jgi:hypothetical protein
MDHCRVVDPSIRIKDERFHISAWYGCGRESPNADRRQALRRPVDVGTPINIDRGLQGEGVPNLAVDSGASGVALMVRTGPYNLRVTPQSKGPGDFRPETSCSLEIPQKIPVSGVTPSLESAELCGVFG